MMRQMATKWQILLLFFFIQSSQKLNEAAVTTHLQMRKLGLERLSNLKITQLAFGLSVPQFSHLRDKCWTKVISDLRF